MKKLYYMFRSFLIAAIGMTASVSTAFAAETSFLSQKNTSYLSDFTGNYTTEQQVNRNFEDIKTNGISNTTVSVNVPQVKNGKGTITLDDATHTSYTDVESPVITDVKATINVPIVYGSPDDVDIKINHESETNYDDTKADYIYDYTYHYDSTVYIDSPYLKEGNN